MQKGPILHGVLYPSNDIVVDYNIFSNTSSLSIEELGDLDELIRIAIRGSIRMAVREILNQKPIDIFSLAKEKKPLKIIFLGFNGTGKTTTIARLGFLSKEKKLEPVFAAADTWRAAAI